MATVTVSFRVTPELLTELDSAAKRAGKERAAFLVELVEAAVEGKSSGEGEVATKLVEAVERLEEGVQAQAKRHARKLSELAAAVERLPTQKDLDELLDADRGKGTEMVAAEVALLRKNLQVALSNLCLIARPELNRDEIVAVLQKSFERK